MKVHGRGSFLAVTRGPAKFGRNPDGHTPENDAPKPGAESDSMAPLCSRVFIDERPRRLEAVPRSPYLCRLKALATSDHARFPDSHRFPPTEARSPAPVLFGHVVRRSVLSHLWCDDYLDGAGSANSWVQVPPLDDLQQLRNHPPSYCIEVNGHDGTAQPYPRRP